MKVLFLCGIYPEMYKDQIFNSSKRGYQFAAQAFQQAVVEGFIQNDVDITVVTYPFISTFPIGYKKVYINFKASKIHDQVFVAPTSFINLPFVRQLTDQTRKRVFQWCEENSMASELHILVYSLNANLMKAAIEAKKRYKNVCLSIIILDLPEYMGANFLYKLLGFKAKDVSFVYSSLNFFDNYVLLTEGMKDHLLIEDGKYCVVEGIFNPCADEINNIRSFKRGVEIILYTGALVKKYGIETLLRAFASIENPKYRLVICGDGEARDLVQEFSRNDPRILYKGKVPHEKIIAYQRQASLLINPRPPVGQYTNFSFPSKTMEYFASGTPVLMYRLSGVPPVYFDYCYVLEDLSEMALANKIIEVLSLDVEVRKDLALKARRFIEGRNAKIQVRRIIDLMDSRNLNSKKY